MLPFWDSTVDEDCTAHTKECDYKEHTENRDYPAHSENSDYTAHSENRDYTEHPVVNFLKILICIHHLCESGSA